MKNLPRVLITAGIVVGILVVCVVLATVLISMGGGPERSEPEQAALLVDAIHPQLNTDNFTVRAQGTVTPRTETSIVAEVSGRLVSMADDFVAGGVFEAGTELARIDPSDYETALLAAQAELASARATLSDESSRSELARKDFERLYGDSRAPGDLVLRIPQVRRAEAAVQAQEAAVQRARRNLERTRIRLPFDAMVRERNADLGQYVAVGTSLAVAFAIDRAEVRLPLSERDLAFLDIPVAGTSQEVNRPVTLLGSVAGRTARWDATLIRTEGVVNQNNRLTYVVAEIRDPYAVIDREHDTPLPMGTFVEAEITGRDARGLVVLPTEAIHNGNEVYLADTEDRLEIRTVEIVRTTPREVYVDNSLTAEDRVIVTAIPAPIPGLRLNVRENTESAEPLLRILPAEELARSEGDASS